MTVKTSAPGKLMLSGEWSVLEVGNPAIVIAVEKRVFAKVEESNELILSFPDIGIDSISSTYDGELHIDDAEKLKIPKAAIETALRYLESKGIKIKTFKLETKSDISETTLEDGTTAKIGFGSSAASTVAMIAAILKFHRLNATKEIIYKLSALSHYLGQGKIGSGFDIAASVYGGIFSYKRFDPDWLMSAYKDKSFDDLMESAWQGFSIEPLTPPKKFTLLVGWTKKGASTRDLVQKMRVFKEKKPSQYNSLMTAIASVTQKLIDNFSESASFELLEENRKILSELTFASGAEIETELLKKLAEIARANGGVGKLSGAGGGDCGIAVTFDASQGERIKAEWERAGIYPLDVKLAENGVKIQ